MKRSGRIVVVSHCILNVHSLEDNLSEYQGVEEDVLKLLISKGVGIFQIPCPEMDLQGIFRKALPKDAYENPKIRAHYKKMAKNIVRHLVWFKKRGYDIVAVLGAEGSPTCGISKVGRWKNERGKREFPRDIEFVEGMGVFMEEFEKELKEVGIKPLWIGIPGKSLKSQNHKIFEKALSKIRELL
ncbi:MAG: CD3072 family TudS-related putative desulfidase [Candidatus Methanofastidiosia archaeon]